MLLEFSAENFRSLRDRQSLDLRAGVTRELAEVVRHPPGLEKDSRGVLPAAAVFGANASGKSSLFMAADFMRTAVLRSAESTVEGSGVLEHAPTFRFDPARRTGPLTLQVLFLLEGIRHEYGFTLQPRGPKDRFTRVASEWLRSWPQTHKHDLFLRGEVVPEGSGAHLWVPEQGFAPRRLAADLFEQTRDDVLFLSVASQRNNAVAKVVVRWFNEQFCTDSTRKRHHTEQQAVDDPSFLGYLSRLLRAADTGIERVEVTREERTRRIEPELDPYSAAYGGGYGYGDGYGGIYGDGYALRPSAQAISYTTRTLHRNLSGGESSVELTEESRGTQRLFDLAGPIHDALKHGRCLWVDELDTAMHHWLVRALIKLFQNPSSNPNGAQLLFTTHDAAVMDPTLLRRDQIWLVEKDAAQGSQLYSLADIEDKPRKGQPLFKSFLSGRFGGVPRLDEADILDWSRDKK